MKAPNARKHKNRKMSTAKRKTNMQILPALVAVGGACGLAAAPASALELGQIRVDSTLGQPLRASIAYALSPNEQMFDFCIFLKPGRSANGIPVVGNVRIAITDSVIVLNGRTPIREPLLAMQLSVNCPYTARLARDYTLMIDPALPGESDPVALSTDAAPLIPVETSTETAANIVSARKPAPIVPASVRPQDDTPIATSSRYLVQAGDSLSQIAARIENRSVALWPAVDAIFAVNPDAFMNNDRDLLKAGSWLLIPDMTDASTVATTISSSAVQQNTVDSDAESSAAYSGVAVADTSAAPVPEAVAATTEEAAEPLAAPLAEAAEPVIATIAEVTRTEMRPGDIIVGTDSPFIIPIGANEVVDIPDIAIEAPLIARPAPAIVSRETGDGGISGAWSWLIWLGGTGLALMLGLFMFGRQLRERFGSVAVGTPAVPSRRDGDEPAPRPVISDIDYNFDDDTLNSRTISLDADLDAGTGLQDGGELDVAQDYGFSASGSNDYQLDLEITEQAAREEDLLPTDIIPPSEKKRETILENEILPTDDDVAEDDVDEDYDMSMIVDATSVALDDITSTTKDLQAVLVATDDDSDSDDTVQTLNKEGDYQILEQDYEDEFTATQVLDKEIEEAARALAERMDDGDAGNDTTEMPVSLDAENTAELTANLPASGSAENEDFDDAGVIPDLTVEMPSAESDTVIEIDAGRSAAKKSKAS